MTTRTPAALFSGRQFHNQPQAGHTHRYLVALWEDVRAATDGKVSIVVHAQNAGVPGSDPQALDMLVAGELEFTAMMGGLLCNVCPPTQVQSLPFVFSSHQQIHRVFDGALGDHLRAELATKGIHLLPRACMENGFRQISSSTRPIRSAGDLEGFTIRVPAGPIFRDIFLALGAKPIPVNINELYAALASGRCDGQENPLVISEVNKLYEVQRFFSITNHQWSGFNIVANLAFWRRLPVDVQTLIETIAARHVAQQRADVNAFNERLRGVLEARGMQFNDAETASFRVRLSGLYRTWREVVGVRTWQLLEAEIGTLSL